jgi:protease I
MARRAGDVKVAILVATGFEQSELTEPRDALHEAGLVSDIVSPENGKVTGWDCSDWGDEFDVDVALDTADPEDYDVLFLPGGVMNPNRLRKDRRAEEFVCSFFEAGKPVAALCHGPWHLVDSGVQRGRKVNSYRSIRTDFETFVDQMLTEFEVDETGEEAALPRIDDGERRAASGSGRPPARSPSTARRHQMIVWVNRPRRISSS